MSNITLNEALDIISRRNYQKLKGTPERVLINTIKYLQESEMRAKDPAFLIGTITNKFSKSLYELTFPNNTKFAVTFFPNVRIKSLKIGDRVTTDRYNNIMFKLPKKDNPEVEEMLLRESLDYSFSDIGGCSQIIKRIMINLILPSELKKNQPAIFKKLKLKRPKGILLTGPPGVGKTLLGKIIASALKANFFQLTGSTFARKFIGEGTRLVDALFDQAEQEAKRSKKISIVFIDEIDAIGSNYSLINSGEKEINRTLAQLLTRMDGFKSTANVIVMGATNRLDLLNPALIRSGRFDEIYEFLLPNEQDRLEIWGIHLKDLPLHTDVSIEDLVKRSENFSGADIAEACREARNNLVTRIFGLESMNDWKNIKTQKPIDGIQLRQEDLICAMGDLNIKKQGNSQQFSRASIQLNSSQGVMYS